MDESEEAADLVDRASNDTIEEMERKGWRRVKETLNRADTLTEVAQQICDSDHCVAVTKSATGYCIWISDWKE